MNTEEEKLKPKEIIRVVAIEFAHFIKTNCFYNLNGYMLYPDKLGDALNRNEYQVDELYDYWMEAVYIPSLP